MLFAPNRPAYPRALLGRGWIGICAALVLALGSLDANAQQFSFRRYTQSDGLPNLAAAYMVADADGDLWVGTDGGVFRYDGTAFVPYREAHGLPSETVRGMSMDPWGRIWVSMDRDLYIGTAAGFQPVETDHGPVIAEIHIAMPIAFIDRNHVLVVSDGHVLDLRHDAAATTALWKQTRYFSEAELKATPALDRVKSIYAQGKGTIWFGCDTHLCSVAGGVAHVWTDKEGVPSGAYAAALVDSAQRLWVRSDMHLLVREPGATTFTRIDPPHARLETRVTEPLLASDTGGRLLVRTERGVARWNGTSWSEFTTENGLPDNAVIRAQIDGEGSLWLSTAGVGIWRWRGHDNVESWTRSEGFASQSVWDIVRGRDGKLLIGTERGCQMLDERAARVVPCHFAGLPQAEVTSLAIDSHGTSWWALDNGEVWTVPERGGEALSVVVPTDKSRVSLIMFDRTSVGWIVSLNRGLFRIDPKTSRITKVVLPRSDVRLYDMTQDAEGNLLIASSGGLFRYSDNKWTFLPVLSEHGNSEVLSSVTTTPDGSVWLSNFGKGVLRARGPNLERREWLRPTILADASIYSLRTDRRGWLWVNTDHGAVVYDMDSWRRFDVDDGLVWNDTDAFSFLSDRDGSVWIGTAAGMTHVRDPERLLHGQGPLELRIANAKLGPHTLEVAGGAPTFPWHADMAFDVRLSSNSYARSSETEFRYRLVGLSSEWFGSPNPEVHVPALDAGFYRLEAVAVDTPHGRKSAVMSLAFEVLPPWWRTLTFGILLALLVVASLAFAWRRQNQKLRARRAALEAEFREREALLERATRDPLTRLWNRATILEILGRELGQAQRAGTPLAVGVIDADHFKHVNDTFGHLGGDEILRELAARLSAALRQTDWLGRFGGEELVVVLPGLTRAEAEMPVDRLRGCVSDVPFKLNGMNVTVTLSIGVAWYESPADSIDEIMGRADAALYDAKRAGRNRVVYAKARDSLLTETTGSRRILNELLERIRRDGQKREPDSKTG